MSKQKTKATIDKKRSERRITNKLADWIRDIVANYRIGDTQVSDSSRTILSLSLRTSYTEAGRDVTTFDIREYKQADAEFRDRLYRRIAEDLDLQYDVRTQLSTNQISKTSSKLVTRTTQLAVENEMSIREARVTLANYLKSQRAMIAATESQWAVEATRATVVGKTADELDEIIAALVALLENGAITEATRLANQISKIQRLPSSETQGDLISQITDNKNKLNNPIVRAEIIASIRKKAQQLDKREKQWQTVGGGDVRASHQRANGQIRQLATPFLLDGGLLQYPGDSSLGAGAEEVINCRCATVYL